MCSACLRSHSETLATPSVPEHVWRNIDVQQALAAWDFSQVTRLIRQHGSLRQDDVAQLTGLSQAFLSMLEAGRRRLTNIDKIAEFLTGLGVPPELTPLPRPAAQHAPVVEVEWESPLEIAKRLNTLTSSHVDPATLRILEQQITDIVDRYEQEGPHQLVPVTTELRTYVQPLLEGQQPPRQREALFRLAAQASGLLGYMAVNAGREVLAEAYCTEAHALAAEIDDQDLMMWALGTRSLSAYYAGRFADALTWAEAGIDINPHSPQAIRLLANGSARALGKLGDATGAQRALAQAEELSGQHVLPDGLTSCISFVPYSLARTLANAATVHVSLGDTPKVIAYAEQIDGLVARSDSAWSQALVRLDVATALLTGARPDVEHAMVLGQQVLDAGGGPPIRSVVQRAGELADRATQWRDLSAVRNYTEALRVWRSSPLTRAVAESAKMTRPDGQPRARGAASALDRQPHSISRSPSAQH
ncbi:helix-turn-helix transcriptional regulator [Streptomyces sp. NPDC051172]|uniref:helix-turn-helix domain-containing protein n=1 Tax=Streptomyces sp. NPDC051172 TaxID=3155796 RepID=UPI003432A9FD